MKEFSDSKAEGTSMDGACKQSGYKKEMSSSRCKTIMTSIGQVYRRTTTEDLKNVLSLEMESSNIYNN